MTGKKKTGRTKQLSLKSTPEFHLRLKNLASREKCLMIEILEQALDVWEKQSEIKHDRNKKRFREEQSSEMGSKRRRI